jgi:hypothetical protein
MLWWIIACGVAARVAWSLYLGDEVTSLPGVFDQISYHTLALRVLDGHGFTFGTGWWPATQANEPTAHWSYLYVLLLGLIYTIAGPHAVVARVAQGVVVGILQPLLTYRIAARIFGHRVGLVAAGVSAGYLYFVYYAGTLVTESLCIVTILWSLDAAMRLVESRTASAGVTASRWLALGSAIAASALLRQVTLLLAPVVLGWVWWQFSGTTRSGGDRAGAPANARGIRPAAGMAIVSAVLALAVVPWTARNYRAFHEFVPLNTNAGFAFFWGNHPIHGEWFVPILSSETYGSLIPAELRGLNEAQMDKALLRRGLGFIADDPRRYAALSASRVVEYIKFWPTAASGRMSNYARVLSFGLCLPFMLAGVVLSCRRPKSSTGSARVDPRVWLLVSAAVVYSLVHILTWTLVRYRLPVDALLMPFGAVAMVQGSDWVLHRVGARGWWLRLIGA